MHVQLDAGCVTCHAMMSLMDAKERDTDLHGIK